MPLPLAFLFEGLRSGMTVCHRQATTCRYAAEQSWCLLGMRGQERYSSSV